MLNTITFRGHPNADACVNFACKRPNFADVGKKMATFCDVLYDGPLEHKKRSTNCKYKALSGVNCTGVKCYFN